MSIVTSIDIYGIERELYEALTIYIVYNSKNTFFDSSKEVILNYQP